MGAVPVGGVPMRLSATPGSTRAPAPLIGEHTVAVLQDWLALPTEEITRLESEGADLAELAARVTESLADLILLAPPADQSKLMADVLANLGQAFLEKSGAIEADESSLRH